MMSHLFLRKTIYERSIISIIRKSNSKNILKCAAVPLSIILVRNHYAVADASRQGQVSEPQPSIQQTVVEKSMSNVSLIEYLKDWLLRFFRKLLKYTSVAKRILYCTSITAPLVVIGPACLYLGMEEYLWNYITWGVEMLGPTFIKLAQWASSRPDIFPEELITRLEKFQDNTTRHPWSTAAYTLDNAFGENWHKDLVLNHEPIGSGCIAQVYKGVLNTPKGEAIPVAVKLIHPHVEGIVKQDMEILSALSEWLENTFPRLEYLSIKDSVYQFSDNMRQQMDLTLEASHLERFNRNFKDFEKVEFPVPISGYVKRNALVETFLSGTPISQFMKPEVDKSLKFEISELAARIMLLMVFRDNFVHGDLHPGNILIRVTEQGPKIILLDCGIVTQVAMERHAAFTDTCLAFLNWDGRKAARLIMDETSKNFSDSVDDFCNGMQAIVDHAKTSNYFEHIGSYIAEICRLSCVHRVKLISDYLHVALAVKVVEGISLSLDPNIDLTSKAIPIVLQSRATQVLDKALGRTSSFSG